MSSVADVQERARGLRKMPQGRTPGAPRIEVWVLPQSEWMGALAIRPFDPGKISVDRRSPENNLRGVPRRPEPNEFKTFD